MAGRLGLELHSRSQEKVSKWFDSWWWHWFVFRFCHLTLKALLLLSLESLQFGSGQGNLKYNI